MDKPFERVAIVGAGTLGAQIALLSAHAGYATRVYDIDSGMFERSVNTVKADIQGKRISPFIPWDNVDALAKGMTVDTDLKAAVEAADLVVEAVPEKLELKQTVFSQLGPLAPPHAIFATNSSSMPVSRMEDSTGRPEQCLNIHFYMPLQGMNMADVMGGTRTLGDVMEKGVAWVRSLGCVPLTVKKELLGFCFNRVWRAIKKETLWMWGNGFVDFRDVDRGWMIFTGMKMGPFGIMDAVGLDVVRDIERVYADASGDPRDQAPPALDELISRGDLGVKAGKGFYSYPNPEYTDPAFTDPRAEKE